MTGDPYRAYCPIHRGSLKLNIYINYNKFYPQGSTKDDTSDI